MPTNFVKVTPAPILVTVQSSGERIVVPSSKKVQVVTVGKVGPSGPAGANADAAFEWATQVFQLGASQQVFVLDFAPRTGSVFVYLNGLMEHFWGLTDTTITLDESALSGDTVVITYQKES